MRALAHPLTLGAAQQAAIFCVAVMSAQQPRPASACGALDDEQPPALRRCVTSRRGSVHAARVSRSHLTTFHPAGNPNFCREETLRVVCQQFHLHNVPPTRRTVLLERCEIIASVARFMTDGNAQQCTEQEAKCCMEWLNATFLLAVYAVESGAQPDIGVTIELITERIFAGVALPDNVPSRVSRKLCNLWRAMVQLRFDVSPAADNDSPLQLSLDLVTALHATVMADLSDEPGCLRSVTVGAAQTQVVYLPHALIRSRLSELLAFTTHQLAACSVVADRMLLTAFFFSSFLKIHPFKNGNGRVARLLANALLRGAAVVPFTPAGLDTAGRERYLHALVESQWHMNHVPLIELFIDAGASSAGNAQWILGIPSSAPRAECSGE
jgi:fido (protein-threonine AMPylation protein)